MVCHLLSQIGPVEGSCHDLPQSTSSHVHIPTMKFINKCSTSSRTWEDTGTAILVQFVQQTTLPFVTLRKINQKIIFARVTSLPC